MASKKENKHWYILVMTDGGPVFVTKINYGNRTAEWHKDEKPLEIDKSRVDDLVIGLNMNCHSSFAVCQPFEIDRQPYNYEDWEIEWKEKEKEQTA